MKLLALAMAGITNETAYSNVCYYLDVPSFIDYLLINFYAANQDWWSNGNWWSDGSVTHGVPFHFFSWDAERTLLSITNDLHRDLRMMRRAELYWSLRQYPEFRRLFGDHAQRLFSTAER